jgi:hypothetical protein
MPKNVSGVKIFWECSTFIKSLNFFLLGYIHSIYLNHKSGADSYLYDETLEGQAKIGPMVDKNVFYIQDQNGGTYNGQILFDTSVLSNSGQWLAYSEDTFKFPL